MSECDCRCLAVTQRFAGQIANERIVVRVLGNSKLDDFYAALCNQCREFAEVGMLMALPRLKFGEDLVDDQKPVRQ